MLKFIYAKIFNVDEELESQFNEEGRTMIQIKAAEKKINRAWENFSFAKPEYTEIAVLELKLAETEHCLLCRKLKIIKGEPLPELKIHIKFPWLKQYIEMSGEEAPRTEDFTQPA